MLSSLVGLTAMDVSLLGPVFSQSVSTLAVCWVAVVQILSPGPSAGPLPNTAEGTGAGASRMLCVNSMG